MSYKLTKFGVLRIADKANIPADALNRDYKEYLQWVADGNAAGPADLDRPLDTDLANATAKLANDPVFRALIKVLAAHFGLTVPQLVNEIKAQV